MLALAVGALTVPVQAATTTLSVLFDTDNNAATGCVVVTPEGPFSGVEQVVNTVTTLDGSGYRVSSVTLQYCSSGALSAPVVVDGASRTLPPGLGVDGATAVESFLPETYLPRTGQKMRLGVMSVGADGLSGGDALLTANGNPIVLDAPQPVVVSTLATTALALTALLLVASLGYARRRGWHGMPMLAVALLAMTLSGQIVAVASNWTSDALLGVDPTGDASAGTDLNAFYARYRTGSLGFMFSVYLNAPPIANGQAVTAVVGSASPITLTGSDYENLPLTFTVLTQPTQGVLTGTAPNLTYTPNANATTSDSFTFKANDGALDSASATVTIAVKLPPTITSANTATFIPAQANSFGFTATGAPAATFALTTCSPTLPASIVLTNNGNNTATLAGTPTLAQGGTYVCTLTASNGFGANATQSFTLNLGLPPNFTSAAATTFTVGTPGTFAVNTAATPTTTSITQSGTLPAGVTFAYNGPGTPLTGTLAGTPAAGTGGTYPIAFGAGNGIAPNAAQNFTLTVNEMPTITSSAGLVCTVGSACSKTITASGFPAPAISRTGAALPAGMTYVDNGNGGGTLSGTPMLATSAVNTYGMTFTPSNGVGSPVGLAFTLTVNKANQTLAFTSAAPTSAAVGGGSYSVVASATSGLPPLLGVDASAAGVCSLSGGTVSFIGVGTCVINANQAGNADYNAAAQVQQSFAVVKANQNIAFTSTVPVGAKVAGPTYAVAAATSPSGLPVTFTIDVSATSVCSIAGATVSFVGVGTCVINANQPGNASYNAAPQVQQSFTVAKGDQAISVTSTAPVAAKVAGPTYTVTATAAPSGLPVAFTIDASATSVCSISGATVSFIAVGTCVVNANQAGNANFNAAPQVQQSFAVAKGDQTISFTSAAPVAAKVVGPSYTVTAAAAPSGLPVTFSIDASATAVCSIAGSTVSFTAAGTCVINANQVGNANFNAAPQVQQSFAVAKGDQVINFTSAAPGAAKVAGATYTVTATATSGLTVAFTIDATASSVCSISGSTVSFIGVGTCVINANQTGNANYNAAPQVQQSFGVTKNDQTTSFTSTPPAGAKVAGATYTVTATATSGLTVTFSTEATAASVCSISGSTVTFIGAGTCVINANQPGNTSYNAAPQVQQSFTVAKGDQAISVTSTAPVAAKVAGPTYTVTATAAPSGLPVAFTIDASATSVCSISGATVSFVAVGTCVINANQVGDANFNAAPQVQQSFAVAKGDQTISFTSSAPVAAKVTGPTYTVTATATSGLAVAFTIDPSAASVCTISGSTVSLTAVGTCVINANQAGTANFNAAPQLQQSFAVAKGEQTITFTSTVPTAAKVGGATYNVAATATSGLTVALTIDLSAVGVCSITGSTVSFSGAGTCLINANQTGNANYNAAPQVQQSFAVTKNDQTISITSAAPVSARVAGATYTVAATATSGLTVAFSIDASATTVCSISGSTVSFIGAGTCVINASQPGNTTYNAALQVQQSFVVAKGDQTIAFTSTAPVAATFGGATYTVTATATSGLSVAFSIDPGASAVCSISGSIISFTGVGTCVINANQTGNGNYNAAPQVQQSFVVAKANQTISFTSSVPATPTVGGSTYTVAATATSGLAVSLSIDAASTAVCSITGTTVSFIGNGSCLINASQTGNANYNAAPQVQQSFVVKSAQTINFTSSPPATPTVSGATYTVSATATSGLAVTFSIDAAATAVCSVSGAVVSFIGAGTCVINANQAGDASYYPAPQVQQSFTVRRAQTISFTSSAPLAVYQGPTYTVTATATSSLTVTFSIDPTSSTVCTIAGSAVSFIGTGNCLINANQAGDATWYPAPQAQQTVTVGPNLQGDSHNVVGNTQHVVASHSAPATPFTAAATDILANDTSNVAIALTTVTNAATTAGGSITIDATGKLTYTPPVGKSTGTDTYDYTGTSNGVSRTATITFTFNGIVWYVNSSGSTGDGRSHSPFTNMGTAVNGLGTALAGTGPATGAYIYVYKGGGSTAGAYALKSNQTLVGEPAGLSLSPLTIPANAANRPTLTGTLSAVSGATGIKVAGVRMSTGASNAIDFNNASADFIGGGLAISTTSGIGFRATGGGTVTVQGAGNSIASTTGTALSVTNTTIGAAGLTFQSVSANGAPSGIVLTGTGASGGLSVTGTGAAGSGGTIQNTTSHGVSLSTTLNPSFASVNIQNTAGSGVKGTAVTNFSFTNGLIDNSGTGGVPDESNIAFNTTAAGTENNLSGTVTITGNTLTNSRYHGVDIANFAGTTSNLTVTGNTLTSSAVAANSLGSGIRIQALGSATTAATVTQATIANNTISNFPTASGILVNCGNANTAGLGGSCGTPGASNKISVTGNTIKGQSAANQMGSNAIALALVGGNGASRSQANFDISNNGSAANPLTNFKGSGVACSVFGYSTATCSVTNNVMVANNIVASRCIAVGVDRVLAAGDTPDLTATIANNNVSACDGNGIFTGALNSTGTARVKIQNNTIAAPLTGNRAGIQVNSGTPSAAGTNTTVCLNISGNTSAGSGVASGLGLRKEGTVTATNAFAVNGMAATASPGVESYVDGLNPAGGGTLLTSATSGFSNCSLP